MKTIRNLLLLLGLHTRGVAANHVPPRDTAIGTAANVAPVGEDEWLQIAPYGDHPHPKGMQKFHRPQADRMVVAFNSFLSRAGRAFRGLPIYIGHPDVMPDVWKDQRRLGKVNELEARADGLYGRVAWNTLGQENQREGFWVYPSPAWLFPKNGNGVIVPDELISVGLWNTPQIAESAPWTANAATDGTNKENLMKTSLIKVLGLAADSTDEQIETAVNAKITEISTLLGKVSTLEGEKTTLNSQLVAANGRVTALETEVQTEKGIAANALKAHAKDLLDVAINSGRITQAERAGFETEFGSDFAAASTKLAERKVAMNTTEITLGDRKQSIATAAERSAIIDSAVNSRMKEHSEDYDTAYNSVSKDPKFAAVFTAMKKSTSEAAQG